MPNLGKVIYGMERCICHDVPDACRDCGYDAKPYDECKKALMRDAMDLLKKQNKKIIDLKKERKDYQTALAMTEQELDELKFERRALFSRR